MTNIRHILEVLMRHFVPSVI